MDTVSQLVHTFALQEVYSLLHTAPDLQLYFKGIILSALQGSLIQPPRQSIA